MGNLHLVTGYAGQEHVKAVDHAAFNAALIGTGQFVLDKGNALQAQVITSNKIRILDGELMMQGRFVRLDPGTYVDLSIDNGASGTKRNDLIVARYTKSTSTGVEEVSLAVIKGTGRSSNPVDPPYMEGDITDGETALNEFPLWRIPIDGLNVGTPERLSEVFGDSMHTLPDIRNQVENIHKEVDAKLEAMDETVDQKISGLESYLKPEVLSAETKRDFGLGTNDVPDDAFRNLFTSVNQNAVALSACAKIATGSYTGNGKISTSGAISITFDFDPKMIWICAAGEKTMMISPMKLTSTYATWGYDGIGDVGFNYAKKVGNTVSWYSSKEAADMHNESGKTYYYVAIG